MCVWEAGGQEMPISDGENCLLGITTQMGQAGTTYPDSSLWENHKLLQNTSGFTARADKLPWHGMAGLCLPSHWGLCFHGAGLQYALGLKSTMLQKEAHFQGGRGVGGWVQDTQEIRHKGSLRMRFS